MPAPLIAAALPGIFDIGGKLIDKLFPDPEKAAEAKAKLALMAQEGELKELQVRMSAIVAEANSQDPWTSRARPSFLYCVYVVILAGIPMGVLHALQPDVALGIAEGFKLWLAAIPEEMWWLFGVGYTGYSAARSYDKGKMK